MHKIIIKSTHKNKDAEWQSQPSQQGTQMAEPNLNRSSHFLYNRKTSLQGWSETRQDSDLDER